MTSSRDIERLLDAWLGEGPSEAPDRVVAVVADRIGRQRQRPAWRARKEPQVSLPIRFALATAAVVTVIGVTAVALLALRSPGPQIGGVGSPAPSATAQPSPTISQAAPSEPPASRLPQGILDGGRYRMTPFRADADLAVTLTVPAGWQGIDWALLGPDDTAAPDGIGLAFLSPAGVFSDPCRWDVLGTGDWPQDADVEVGPSVDDLVAALVEQDAYTAGPAADVTIGGYPGKRLTLELPAIEVETCDRPSGRDQGAYFVFGPSDSGGTNLFAQGSGQRWHLWIVDVDGTRVVIVLNDYEGTPDALEAAGLGIVESIEFSR